MRSPFFILVFIFFSSIAPGQTLVRGKVCFLDGTGMEGVQINEKGRENHTTSNADGEYQIIVLQNAELIFKYHGIDSVTELVGNRTEINVTFSKIQFNQDFILSPFNYSKPSEISASQQKVFTSEAINLNNVNFIHSMSGRVAGLDVRKNSSGAGGSTRVNLRGFKSFITNSNPIFILDGIPIANVVGEQPGMWGGIDQGDGLSQINPDDIKSITVLKGMNAAAIYGSHGINGVLDIRTKSGIPGKMRINIKSGVSFEKVALIPEFQFKYGAESGSKESWSENSGNYNNSFINDYFSTGVSFINSINVSGGNSKTTSYFSYSNASLGGVTVNNKYRRNNLSYKQSTNLLDKRIVVSSLVMLVNEVTDNKSPAGYYLNPLTGLYLFPRNGYDTKDFAYYKNNYEYFREDRNLYWQNWFVNDHLQSNPYWILNKERNEYKVNRVVGNLSFRWNLLDDLNLSILGGYDYSERQKEVKHYAGSNAINIHPNGGWDYQKYTDELKYAEANISYKKRYGNLVLKTMVGAKYQESIFGEGVEVSTGILGLVYPNEFYFQNLPSSVQVHSTIREQSTTKALFSQIALGFYDLLYLDFTLGKEWRSFDVTGSEGSFSYPALGLTTMFNKLFKMPDWVTFANIRTSVSKGSMLVPPHYGELMYLSEIKNGDSNGANGSLDIKPENHRSIEIGADCSLFNSRLTWNFTYYNTQSTGQLIRSNTAFGTLNSITFFNAGKIINKGIEVAVDVVPLKRKNSSWSTSLNFSSNNNTIVSLHPEVNWLDLGSEEGYSVRAAEGGSFGDLYVYKFKRNAEGKTLFDEEGKPLRSRSKEYIGNVEPSWSLGWYNSLQYNNFELSLLVDSKVGGKVFSQTEAILDGYGVSARTADSRDLGYVEVDGIIEATGERITNADPAKWYQTVGHRNGIGEQYVYSRTNVRLSKAVVSYNFNFKKNNLRLSSVKFSLVGSNLLFLYLDAPFDPELGMSSNRFSQSLDNFNFPATRSIGFNIGLNF